MNATLRSHGKAVLSFGKDVHVGRLVAAGVSLGVVHVLSGPDHLSALATLSVGGSFKSFSLGARWGMGHSMGLLLVASLFIALEGEMDLESLEYWGDVFVGVAMVAMGCVAVRQALRLRHARTVAALPLPQRDPGELDDLLETVEGASSTPIKPHAHGYSHAHDVGDCWCFDLHSPNTQRAASLAIGLVHGVAGPGGILGVMPAVALHNYFKASVYLASFCTTSILVMGTFAALYGEATSRFGRNSARLQFWLSLVSAAMSFVVGILWLYLAANEALKF